MVDFKMRKMPFFSATEAVSHPDGAGFSPLRLASYAAINAVLHRKIGSVTT